MEFIVADLGSANEPHGYVAWKPNNAGLWEAKVETTHETFTAVHVTREKAIKWVHEIIGTY
jgi:hypothetical protein